MDKSKLRVQYKKIRESIEDREIKSNEIAKKIVQSMFYEEAKVIGVYSSLSSEVDTASLIIKALSDKKIVVLPKVVSKEELEFYSISKLEELEEKGAFGIKEPLAKVENFIDKDKIDLMIVPGVCFDKNKNRVGFGKGFYDRYLAHGKNIIKVGICFDEQVLQNGFISTDEYDVKMDMVITDKENYK